MPNPYLAKDPSHFWRSAVAQLPPGDVWPVPARRFILTRGSRITTAGSCFAQNVAKVLVNIPGIEFVQTEQNAPDQPMFSALYGNIYTVRQLRQLFDESLGSAPPYPIAWRRNDGRFVDALRPAMFADGFPTPEAVATARAAHLAAVRQAFCDCSVFVFTLGLTEAWEAGDGTVFPVAPGVVAEDADPTACQFHNFTYEEILADLDAFVVAFQRANPTARIILTVSPVPLVATYTQEHVLVATMHSKSILRAVCSAAESRWPHVFYFPSYEIVIGHYNNGAYFDANKRTIRQEGIDHVMRVFRAAYLASDEAGAPSGEPGSLLDEAFAASNGITCDEELLTKSFGF